MNKMYTVNVGSTLFPQWSLGILAARYKSP